MSDDNENSTDSEGIRNLRKQYEDQAKELKALRESLAGYQKAERQTTVASILKAKGLPEKAASLYSGEDVSEDAVGKWAENYADIFGAQPASTQSGTPADPNAAAAARMAAATQSSPSTQSIAPDGYVVGDPNEMLHAIKTLPYEELVKLGYMPKQGGIFDPAPR